MTQELTPPPVASDEEYACALQSGEFWEPYARAALRRAGMQQPNRLEIHVVGTYPTLVADTGVVVKLFGDRWFGPESHQVEREAFDVLEGSDLPVPELLAVGELCPDSAWPWPFFILSRVEGVAYGDLRDQLDAAAHREVAAHIATVVKSIHRQRLLPGGDYLSDDWGRFLDLLRRRRQEAMADHLRWGNLPERLGRQINSWVREPDELVDLSRSPLFVHGDLHADHVFLDPSSLEVTGVIDFTDAYAGDRRYDLVALHFGTFCRCTDLLRVYLDIYEWTPDVEGSTEAMLSFTLLHDFNMFDGFTPADFDGIESLSELAHRLWDLNSAGLQPSGT